MYYRIHFIILKIIFHFNVIYSFKAQPLLKSLSWKTALFPSYWGTSAAVFAFYFELHWPLVVFGSKAQLQI